MNRPAVFLDRDGVINSLIYHRDMGIIDSPFTLAQFTLLPRVAAAIRRLNQMQLPVVIVSNQPGIAKRHFTVRVLRSLDRRLNTELRRAGAWVDAIYYCLHHPQAVHRHLRRHCHCRKPGIGLLLRAAQDLGVSLPNSYMVGDGLSDIEAGTRAGCCTIFLGRWKCEHCRFIHPPFLQPSFVARDLWEAVGIIATDLAESSVGLPSGSRTQCRPAGQRLKPLCR
ncbi:MAG TPA: HAD family hydrolase [Terriglobales bacterium]|nr:HAD family hydrolase [Terriglobales bacterium]